MTPERRIEDSSEFFPTKYDEGGIADRLYFPNSGREIKIRKKDLTNVIISDRHPLKDVLSLLCDKGVLEKKDDTHFIKKVSYFESIQIPEEFRKIIDEISNRSNTALMLLEQVLEQNCIKKQLHEEVQERLINLADRSDLDTYDIPTLLNQIPELGYLITDNIILPLKINDIKNSLTKIIKEQIKENDVNINDQTPVILAEDLAEFIIQHLANQLKLQR